jgi:hypothetical protein
MDDGITGWAHYVSKPSARGKRKGGAANPNPKGTVPHTANAALQAFYEQQQVAPADELGKLPTRL